MAFTTPGRRVQPLPELALMRRDGRIVHQPVRGLGTLYSPAPIAPSALPTTATPGAQVQQTRLAISNNETLRFATPGTLLPVAGNPGALTGIVLALKAHLEYLASGWWAGADRNWAQTSAAALGALVPNEAGHYDPGQVRAAVMGIPSAVRGRLDATISGGGSETARRLVGYTTARLISDIDAGRYRATTIPTPSAIRDTTGRTSGPRAGLPLPNATPNTTTSSTGSSLFDRMSARMPGASAAAPIPYEGGMDPTGVRLTPEQYAEATGVPLPPAVARQLTPLGTWWAENSARVLGSAVGFALGFAILRWRAR